MSSGQFKLLGTRRFWPLFVAQALGAFNDNAFRAAIAILITYELAQGSGTDAAFLITAATALFVLPFFLFSALAGELADAYDKALLARWIKFAEIGIMAFAAASLLTDSPWIQIFFLFLAGTQSAFFGPIKYGILPQLLRRDELLGGNGLIEMATFVAILLGTLFGGLFVLTEGGRTLVGITTVLLAVIGWLTALLIPPAPPARHGATVHWNQLKATGRVLAQAMSRRVVFQAILGVSWFWLLGAIFLTELPVLTKTVLGGNERLANFFIAAFTIGIAMGSVAANRLLKAEISARYVPVTALLLGAVTIELFFAVSAAAPPAGAGLQGIAEFLSHWSGWRVFLDLVAVSFLAGIYVVPLYALVQARSATARRARMIAANNIVNAGLMAAGTGVTATALGLALTIPQLFLALGIANLLVAAYAVTLMPREIAKQAVRLNFRLLYRVDVRGLEHIRSAGRAVIVAKHCSPLDAPLLGAFLPGRVVIALDHLSAKEWWIRPASLFCDFVKVDPTSPSDTRGLVRIAKRGGRVVMFPEGRITEGTTPMKTYPGPAIIAQLAGARIVPVRIAGAHPPLFPPSGRRQRIKLFPKISLTVLEPVEIRAPEGVKGSALQEHFTHKLYDVMTDLVFRTSPIDRHLVTALVDARSAHGGRRPMVEDIDRAPIALNRLLMGTFILGRKLAALTPGQTNVGVLLPSAVGCLVTFYGLLSFGRVPTMLNYSTGAVNMAAACLAAEVRTVVTSRRFIEQGGFDQDLALLAKQARIVFLEDVRASVSAADKLYGVLASRFPGAALRLAGANLDPNSPAVILFTSGSEGLPKGVVLSHRNVQANCAQVATRIGFSGEDVAFNPLPMFHAFGLTVGTILPLQSGVRAFLYPSPLHYKVIPEFCYEAGATILLGTDTFLMGFARNAHPFDFHSVRYVVAGAERVKPETRELWMNKFGLRIIEGYGATECSPVIATNTPMHFKPGTVGRLLDGIEHRLVAVEGISGAGRLMVRGPNVMLGYLHADEPGSIEPPEEGWHDSGDIVSIDEVGFLTIEGRAKRFSKIGGEMVSHQAIESKLAAAFPGAEHAVVAARDERKGEQLVLMTTHGKLDRKALLDELRAMGASELMVPRRIIHIEELPVLASGKTNYVALNQLARELLGG